MCMSHNATRDAAEHQFPEGGKASGARHGEIHLLVLRKSYDLLDDGLGRVEDFSAGMNSIFLGQICSLASQLLRLVLRMPVVVFKKSAEGSCGARIRCYVEHYE